MAILGRRTPRRNKHPGARKRGYKKGERKRVRETERGGYIPGAWSKPDKAKGRRVINTSSRVSSRVRGLVLLLV